MYRTQRLQIHKYHGIKSQQNFVLDFGSGFSSSVTGFVNKVLTMAHENEFYVGVLRNVSRYEPAETFQYRLWFLFGLAVFVQIRVRLVRGLIIRASLFGVYIRALDLRKPLCTAGIQKRKPIAQSSVG